MKQKEHMSLYGIGPVYGAIIITLTVAAVFFRNAHLFESGRLTALKVPLIVLGVILILLGVFMWVQAVIIAKIDDGIKQNELVTTGIYGWVRNPIYSAIMIACTGVVLMCANAFFLLLPFVYWLLMTVLVASTEEKWLRELFGSSYNDYCKHVNRCIPWKRKHKC